MNEEKRLRFKILSHLLQFPENNMMASLESIQEAVSALPNERPREVFESFLPHLRSSPLIELQEEYTRVFDLTPSVSLNLTYHQFGNDRKRGDALARLNAIYRAAGYESFSGELPDFFPLILEFLSIAPEGFCAQMLEGVQDQVTTMRNRLKEMKSIYADLLDAF